MLCTCTCITGILRSSVYVFVSLALPPFFLQPWQYPGVKLAGMSFFSLGTWKSVTQVTEDAVVSKNKGARACACVCVCVDSVA